MLAEEEPDVIAIAVRPGMVDTDVSPLHRHIHVALSHTLLTAASPHMRKGSTYSHPGRLRGMSQKGCLLEGSASDVFPDRYSYVLTPMDVS
jgi:hypothetical protein